MQRQTKTKKGKLQVLGFFQIPCKLKLDKLRHTLCKLKLDKLKHEKESSRLSTLSMQNLDTLSINSRFGNTSCKLIHKQARTHSSPTHAKIMQRNQPFPCSQLDKLRQHSWLGYFPHHARLMQRQTLLSFHFHASIRLVKQKPEQRKPKEPRDKPW